MFSGQSTVVTIRCQDDGTWINDAASAASSGLPVLLGTGNVAGSAYLALHASHGIRYGLDPTAALAAITSAPAKLFGIDDKVVVMMPNSPEVTAAFQAAWKQRPAVLC